MSRAIVHKTKGKLDLRSLTVFGMNAKPNTDTPIGYFGTGLKYAIAVLARNRIPVTFWIDRKQWVIEVDPTSFRGRDFQEIYICSTTIGGLIKKRIKLPFTTDLGKNWELWQAFRELECNTRDEKGMTFIATVFEGDEHAYVVHGIAEERQTMDRGYTCIVVSDERYVNEYLNRDKHFLVDGLNAQTTTESLQVFARKSDYIYYRGIRIFDLKEPTQNTYNFLRQIDLTEDRTAKYPFQLEMDIERYITSTDRRDVIEHAITAPPKTYERGLSYEYTPRSPLFLDMAAEAGPAATQHVQSTLRRDRPPKIQQDGRHWLRLLSEAVGKGDYDLVEAIITDHKTEVQRILDAAADQLDARNEQLPDGMVGGVQQKAGRMPAGSVDDPDDLPF